MRKLLMAATACFLFSEFCRAETYTLETYYPSPAGVYANLTVTSMTALAATGGGVVIGARSMAGPHQLKVAGSAEMDFVGLSGYESRELTDAAVKPGERKPAPGRILYDKTVDQFYYSSSQADEGDKTTWLKPLGATGFESVLVSEGGVSGFPLPKALTPLASWVATTGESFGNGLQASNVKGGLYVIKADVTLCSPAGFMDKSVTIKLYTRIAGGVWRVMSFVDGDNITLPPGECETFGLDGMLPITKGGVTVYFGIRAKRVATGDVIQGAQMSASRVLSF